VTVTVGYILLWLYKSQDDNKAEATGSRCGNIDPTNPPEMRQKKKKKKPIEGKGGDTGRGEKTSSLKLVADNPRWGDIRWWEKASYS